MPKEFNITGTCIPVKHYMVDTSEKINRVFQLIERGKYFTINRPRQFGKTTTLSLIKKMLRKNPDYLISSISFEGIGDAPFQDEFTLSPFVFKLIGEGFYNEELTVFFTDRSKHITDIKTLSSEISSFIKKSNKKVVLLIDEVDKSINNQLFLSFIGMLRNKYLLREEGEDFTFHSVILAGVHDVKNLKLKLRPDAEQKFNSPWNIATEFTIDLSFNPKEISTMLIDYAQDKKVEMDIMRISERIYHYTSGYPFLVSRICKEIDEIILPEKMNNSWTERDVDDAVKTITLEKNTNLSDMVKNIENNKNLSEFILNLIIGNKEYSFLQDVPLIELAYVYGMVCNKNGKVKIHNKIYEEYLTNYFVFKISTENKTQAFDVVQSSYIKPDGKLDFEKVLIKFQEVIKEKHSKTDVLKSKEFLEKNLRMLFFVFLKPIINGIGFSFKEVETGEEMRMDIVVIFKDEKFVVELKLWHSMEYHRQGIVRLKNYMEKEGVQKGYMLIMDKTRHKEFMTEHEEGLMMVWI